MKFDFLNLNWVSKKKKDGTVLEYKVYWCGFKASTGKKFKPSIVKAKDFPHQPLPYDEEATPFDIVEFYNLP